MTLLRSTLPRLLPALFAGSAVAAFVACTLSPAPRPTVCEEGTPGCVGPPTSDPQHHTGTSGGTGPTDNGTSGSVGTSSGGINPGDSGPDVTPGDDGGTDAGTDSSPVKDPSCKTYGTSACYQVQNDCACQADCCGGLKCAQIGGLVQLECCAAEAQRCGSNSDCCGQLLCLPGDGGELVCQ